jgi:hypothetical protein
MKYRHISSIYYNNQFLNKYQLPTQKMVVIIYSIAYATFIPLNMSFYSLVCVVLRVKIPFILHFPHFTTVFSIDDAWACLDHDCSAHIINSIRMRNTEVIMRYMMFILVYIQCCMFILIQFKKYEIHVS